MRAHELNTLDAAAERLRSYALRPDQQAFVHVVPAETGLARTIWVSQSENYPALLVNPRIGRVVHPPHDVLVVAFDEDTRFGEVNTWLRHNRHLLKPLAEQDIDIGHFYDQMVPLGKDAVTEMVNLPRRISSLPMVIYCSPRNARHDVRVKVSPVHGDRMMEDAAISIAVRPAPHYPRSESRRLSPEDFSDVSAWIVRNEQSVVDYWDMKIDTNEFRRRIAANNPSSG
jgi:hypothetical protein